MADGKHIDFGYCDSIDYTEISKFSEGSITAKGCEQIEEFIPASNFEVGNFSVSHIDDFFSDADFLQLVSELEQVASVSVTRSNLLKLDFGLFCARLSANLEHLDLSRNSFSDQHLCTLAERLRSLSSLQTLKLDYCRLKDTDATVLSTYFNDLKHIRVLSLEGNELRASFCIQPLTELQDINLKFNPLSDQAWKEIFEQVAELPVKTIRLTRCEIGKDLHALLRDIIAKHSGEIDVFELIDVQLVYENVGAFPITRCNRLSISNVQISDPGISMLRGIRCLDLSYCSITSPGLVKLTGCFFDICHSLETLNISGNFCDQNAAHALRDNLSSLHKLRRLEVASLCLDSINFITLLEGIAISNLTELNISGNMNKSTGALSVRKTLSFMAPKLPSLQIINLSDNSLESLQSLEELLQNVIDLNLERTDLKLEDAQTIEVLSSAKRLKVLNLGEAKLDSDNFLARPPLCLSSLYLCGCTLNPSCFPFLINTNFTMTEIDLSGSPLTSKVLADLFAVLPPSLKSLNLSYTYCGDAVCSKIDERVNLFESLRTLRLGHDRITDAGVELLLGKIGKLKELRCLDLSANSIEGNAFKEFRGCETSFLMVLDIRKNPLVLGQDFGLHSKFHFLVDLLTIP